jgi:hypothetical protein
MFILFRRRGARQQEVWSAVGDNAEVKPTAGLLAETTGDRLAPVSDGARSWSQSEVSSMQVTEGPLDLLLGA